MDLREIKTKRAIKNAFLQLRAHNHLEKITIKELAALAEISKATFYLHYRDIYDLSDTLEKEVIKNIISGISKSSIEKPHSKQFTTELFDGFYANQALISTLFSGSRSSVLPTSIEEGIRNLLFSINPELKEDMKYDVLLTYQIQGSYYAYIRNRDKYDTDSIIEIISFAVSALFEINDLVK